MADPKTYASIGEKYEALTAGKRQRPGMIWLQNPTKDTQGNFTLVEVSEKQFNAPNSPYKKRGFAKYVHAKVAPAPVEAKKA